MARGFSGMPGNLGGLMKQAQKMQADLQRVQEEGKKITAEASSGGGMVKAVCNGENQIVSLSIDPQIIDPKDPEMLQDVIVAAVNEALQKIQEEQKAAMAKVAGGVNIPGLF